MSHVYVVDLLMTT